MASPTGSKDPLELARRQLDFSAVATGAPGVKDILFKAQTMAPLSPARPWKRITATAAAVAAVFLLVLAPWLPQRSSLALLKVDFERQFERPAAQELLSLFVREMPDAALLGAGFASATGTAGGSAGLLTLRASSLSMGTAELERTVRRVLSEQAPEAQPCQIHSGQIRHIAWRSPLARVTALIEGRGGRAAESASGAVAHSVVAQEAVLAEGLRGQLAQSGHKLEDFGFVDGSAGAVAEYDFVLPCWPVRVGVSVENYQGLLDSEQVRIQRRAAEFFRAANLYDTQLVLASGPQPWLPLVVEVRDIDGQPDPWLTGRVQAWVVQPASSELNSIDFDPQELVSAAAKRALPDYECRIEFDQNPGASDRAGSLPAVRVTVTGLRMQQFPPIVPSKFSEPADSEY